MYKILIIEDDLKLTQSMQNALEKFDYEVLGIADFRNIEDEFDRVKPHLVLLDINLPYFDGFYLCRVFRRKSSLPIIIISARNDDMHQVMGMELGADDYITKPFAMEVLVAKIHAAIRRCYGEYTEPAKKIAVKGLQLDENSFKVSYRGITSELSKNEFKLLKKLIENADKILSRTELLDELWDDSSFVDDNTLTVNVTRVKNRLEAMDIHDVIKTKRGLGYLFDSSSLRGEEK